MESLTSVACQALLSLEFSREEYWNGVPFPSPRDLPDSGIKPRSSEFHQLDSLPSEPPGKPKVPLAPAVMRKPATRSRVG